MSWLDKVVTLAVQSAGSLIGTRPTVNFTGASVTVTDDSANNRVNVAIASSSAPDATTTSKGIVQLAGDIAGTATSVQVAKVNGVSVSGTPTAGQVITASSGTAAAWATPSGGGGFSLGLLSARPAAGTAGRVYLATDCPSAKFVDDGIAWRPLVDRDCVLGYEPLPLASWTADPNNYSGASAKNISGTTAGGGLVLSSTTATFTESNNGGWYIAKSGAKTIEAFIRINQDCTAAPAHYLAGGLYFAESSTGRCVRMIVYSAGDANMQTSVTIKSGVATIQNGHVGSSPTEFWVKLTDDGTNIIAYYRKRAADAYTQAGSQARGAYLTTTPGGDQAGVFVSPYNGTGDIEIVSFEMY